MLSLFILTFLVSKSFDSREPQKECLAIIEQLAKTPPIPMNQIQMPRTESEWIRALQEIETRWSRNSALSQKHPSGFRSVARDRVHRRLSSLQSRRPFSFYLAKRAFVTSELHHRLKKNKLFDLDDNPYLFLPVSDSDNDRWAFGLKIYLTQSIHERLLVEMDLAAGNYAWHPKVLNYRLVSRHGSVHTDREAQP